ncbi:MAG: hypothetical protein ACTSX6_04590 [Candidatus Heimdallarchaeaceae archaeon]
MAKKYWCRYCKRNIEEQNIAVFDVINGCACDDCFKEYEKDKQADRLKTPFS